MKHATWCELLSSSQTERSKTKSLRCTRPASTSSKWFSLSSFLIKGPWFILEFKNSKQCFILTYFGFSITISLLYFDFTDCRSRTQHTQWRRQCPLSCNGQETPYASFFLVFLVFLSLSASRQSDAEKLPKISFWKNPDSQKWRYATVRVSSCEISVCSPASACCSPWMCTSH